MSFNPRKKHEKLRNSYNSAIEILSSIEDNNNIEVLNSSYNEYQQRSTTRARKAELSANRLLYRKYLRYKEKVRSFLLIYPGEPPVECLNCYRRPSAYLSENFGNNYHLNLHSCRSDKISRGRLFQTIPQNSANPITYTLCSQCHSHLTIEDNKRAKVNAYSWPGFLWFLLSNEEVQQIYKEAVWRFIPIPFRHWWIDAVKLYFPTVYSNVSINSPSAIFKDVTTEIDEWNDAILSHQLPQLSQICNKYLMPTVLCPWGCSTFKHKVGNISIDLIFQRYIDKCNIKMIDGSKISKVKWTRDDYVRDENDEWDAWLMNDAWKILPSVAFMNGNLVVLTCLDHDGGSNKMMIHPCRWEHHLPANQSDQVAPLVIQSRVVRGAKAKKYSDEWQMMEQRGTFTGLETCNHVEFGRFDKYSKLRFEVEARSIKNRYDINAHLETLCNKNVLSRHSANDMRVHAESFSIGRDYEKLYRGGTYIPFEIAIAYQKAARDCSIKVTIINGENNPQVTFRKIWSDFLYPCQKVTMHGAQFATVPAFNSRNGFDTKLLWKLSAILTQVDAIWKSVCSSVCDNKTWYGWFLVYLTKKCFPTNRKSSRRDPFKYSEMSSIEKLASKLPIGANLSNLFTNIDSIQHLDVTEDEVRGNFHNIIENALLPTSQSIVISIGLVDDDIPMIGKW
jgi:hypothetical protein